MSIFFQVCFGVGLGYAVISFVLGQLCDVVDLDGPTFLARDRAPGVTYEQGMIWADEAIWGGRSRATS